ncbi:unnamed protein product [Sympodiomycopsis kandeliae]
MQRRGFPRNSLASSIDNRGEDSPADQHLLSEYASDRNSKPGIQSGITSPSSSISAPGPSHSDLSRLANLPTGAASTAYDHMIPPPEHFDIHQDHLAPSQRDSSLHLSPIRQGGPSLSGPHEHSHLGSQSFPETATDSHGSNFGTPLQDSALPMYTGLPAFKRESNGSLPYGANVEPSGIYSSADAFVPGARSYDGRFGLYSGGASSSATYWSNVNDNSMAFQASSQSSAQGDSGYGSWGSRPQTAEEGDANHRESQALGNALRVGDTRARGWSSSSIDNLSPSVVSTPFFAPPNGLIGGDPSLGAEMGQYAGNHPTQHGHRPEGTGGSVRSSGLHSSNVEDAWSGERKKRPRRKFGEIDRMYKCGYKGCEKAYGTLNHLNAHVALQSHGVKRNADEFRELRREWRARRKEEGRIRDAQGSPSSASTGQSASESSQRPHRLPPASITRPRGNTNVAGAGKQPLLVRPGRSASGPTPMSSTFGGNSNFLVPGIGLPGSTSSSNALSNSASNSASSSPSLMYPMQPHQGISNHLSMPLNLPGPEPPSRPTSTPRSTTINPLSRPVYWRGPDQSQRVDTESHQGFTSMPPLPGSTGLPSPGSTQWDQRSTSRRG